MTTTAHRSTVTARVAKGAETPLSRMVAARRDTAYDEIVALASGRVDVNAIAYEPIPADPVKEARRAALDSLARATKVADAARLTALAHADVIDWARLPESGAYRATVRNWLDAVCTGLERGYWAAAATAEHFDPDAHPIAHRHFLIAAGEAWRERNRWAKLRDDVKIAGR